METLSFALICKLIILMPLIIGSQDGSAFHFLRLTAGNLETIIGELEAFGESELRRVLSADVDAGRWGGWEFDIVIMFRSTVGRLKD